MKDVIIIGTGVCGAAVARELSKYRLNILCLEKDNDVANGTSKANSGIVHGGYDPKPNTKMAKLNVLGNELTHKLAKDLDIPFENCGSLVLAFDENDMTTIEKLYNQGVENNVPNMKILTKEEVLAKEPNISKNVIAALYSPTAGVISPWELASAQLEVAAENGVELLTEKEVVNIKCIDDYYEVETSDGSLYKAKAIINAAGVYADVIQSFVEKVEYKTIPNKGQYYLLDKSQGEIINHVIFQCPSQHGKGVLISPTCHGNLIVGPDSTDIDDRDDVSTDKNQLDYIRKTASKSCEIIDYSQSIRNFSGVRAQGDYDDFIIKNSKEHPYFINLANIKSPGLTASPAIALEVADMLKQENFKLEEKETYVTTRHFPRFRELDAEGRNELIKKDPRYGHVICRCETITEGEIVAAVNSKVPAKTVDAVKRRCNAGMGRCQGGFCSSKIVEIISRELNIKPDDVMKDKANSYILTGKTSKGE